MNHKAKGARRERQARDLLYSWGAHAVTKAGASLGLFDLLALMDGQLVCVQVKSNRWPDTKEMQALRDFPNLLYIKKLVIRYRDGKRDPDVKEL